MRGVDRLKDNHRQVRMGTPSRFGNSILGVLLTLGILSGLSLMVFRTFDTAYFIRVIGHSLLGIAIFLGTMTLYAVRIRKRVGWTRTVLRVLLYLFLVGWVSSPVYFTESLLVIFSLVLFLDWRLIRRRKKGVFNNSTVKSFLKPHHA